MENINCMIPQMRHFIFPFAQIVYFKSFQSGHFSAAYLPGLMTVKKDYFIYLLNITDLLIFQKTFALLQRIFSFLLCRKSSIGDPVNLEFKDKIENTYLTL